MKGLPLLAPWKGISGIMFTQRDTTTGSPNKHMFPYHVTIYNNMNSTLAKEL